MWYVWPVVAILTVLDAILVYGGTDYLIMSGSRLAWMEVIGLGTLCTTVTACSVWIRWQVTHVCVARIIHM